MGWGRNGKFSPQGQRDPQGKKLDALGIDFETWDIQATQLRFDWGGHVARLKFLDPSRLTFRVFQHWDYGMIVSKTENQNNGKQCHNRYLHILEMGIQHVQNHRFKVAGCCAEQG